MWLPFPVDSFGLGWDPGIVFQATLLYRIEKLLIPGNVIFAIETWMSRELFCMGDECSSDQLSLGHLWGRGFLINHPLIVVMIVDTCLRSTGWCSGISGRGKRDGRAWEEEEIPSGGAAKEGLTWYPWHQSSEGAEEEEYGVCVGNQDRVGEADKGE